MLSNLGVGTAGGQLQQQPRLAELVDIALSDSGAPSTTRGGLASHIHHSSITNSNPKLLEPFFPHGHVVSPFILIHSSL